jgi:FHA domain
MFGQGAIAMKWKKPGSSDDKGKRSSGSEPSPGAGKTTYVGRSSSDEETTGSPSGGIRSGPSPRLPWPARDQQQQAKKVVYHTNGSSSVEASDRTQLHDPNKANDPSKPAVAKQLDPVVGWLVVVEGPGKGRSIEIGIGSNSIGRDARQKIALNFGDETIHREKHAMLIFDPKSAHFFLQAGGDSRNLTYIGDSLVLSPVELKGGEIIVVGQTKLAFVAFCGPDFNWS